MCTVFIIVQLHISVTVNILITEMLKNIEHPKQIWCTVKPVLSNHIKQDIFLAFQTGGCLLLNESSAESSYELSVLLSFSNKQPSVYSDFQVT